MQISTIELQDAVKIAPDFANCAQKRVGMNQTTPVELLTPSQRRFPGKVR